ncbi:MAG: hypothetical protein KA140_03395 [Caldisericia bacterium]|nr:hypothetical protein [Caldisericia bacterium]
MKKILLVVVLIASSYGFSMAQSAQTPNMPMLPASREGMFTQVSQITDQWLELDGFAGKKVFALSDGKQMDNVVLPASSNSYILNSISAETNKGPSGNFPYVQAEDGKRYLPNRNLECKNTDKKRFYSSGCGVDEIYPDGYYFVVETPSYSDFHIYRFYKVGVEGELWHMACYGDSIIYRVGKWYVYINAYNNYTYSLYEMDSGKNVLNTVFKHNNGMGGHKSVGDYLFMFGRVFDTRTWKLVFDFGDIHLYGARIQDDTISFLYLNNMQTKDDKYKFFYQEWSLTNNKLIKEVETDIPIMDDRKNYSSVNGSFNGFVYYQNVLSHSFEILNINTKQVVFSHPVVGFDYLDYKGYTDNGRHIVYMDKSDIFCYDTQTGKLWKRNNTELLTKGSCDGQWVISNSGYTDGRNWIDLVHAQFPDRKVTITDQKGIIYTELDCVLEVVQNDYKHIFNVIRHELDGTVKTLEPPIKYDSFLYPFLSNGHWHFATKVDGKLIVMTSDKTSIRIVYEQEVDEDSMFIRDQNNELLFTQSKTKLVIVKNFVTGEKGVYDIAEGVTWPEFAGNRFILFRSGFPFQSRILDRKTGEVTPYEKLALIDADNDTLYFSGEKEFAIFRDGEFETFPTKSKIMGDIVKDGLIVGPGAIYDTAGQFIQKISLPRIGSASDSIKEVNTMSSTMAIDLGQDETWYTKNRVFFETCPTFSLNRGDGCLVLENLSAKEISGKIWIADLMGKEQVIEFEDMDFACSGGEKLEFGKAVASGHCVVYVESNAMMDTSKSALENVDQSYEMPLFEGNPLYQEKQKAVVVTEWGK